MKNINVNLTKEDIIHRIGYFRNKRKLSAYKLGKMLGHAQTYFYRIESGEINLTLETLLDTLQILEVSTFEFFYPDLNKYEEDVKYLDSLHSLSEEERNSIMTILKVKK